MSSINCDFQCSTVADLDVPVSVWATKNGVHEQHSAPEGVVLEKMNGVDTPILVTRASPMKKRTRKIYLGTVTWVRWIKRTKNPKSPLNRTAPSSEPYGLKFHLHRAALLCAPYGTLSTPYGVLVPLTGFPSSQQLEFDGVTQHTYTRSPPFCRENLTKRREVRHPFPYINPPPSNNFERGKRSIQTNQLKNSQ